MPPVTSSIPSCVRVVWPRRVGVIITAGARPRLVKLKCLFHIGTLHMVPREQDCCFGLWKLGHVSSVCSLFLEPFTSWTVIHRTATAGGNPG